MKPCAFCEDEPCVFNKYYYYLQWYGKEFDFGRVNVSNKARRRVVYDDMCRILGTEDIEDLPPCLLEGVRMVFPNNPGEPYSSTL